MSYALEQNAHEMAELLLRELKRGRRVTEVMAMQPVATSIAISLKRLADHQEREARRNACRNRAAGLGFNRFRRPA